VKERQAGGRKMKTAALIAAALASINNACKKSQHSRCVPASSIRHDIKS
jgi:hypothetical protein